MSRGSRCRCWRTSNTTGRCPAAAPRIAKWLGRDPSKRQSSLARDESVLRNHLLPTLGSRKLATVTPWDIQHLVNAWAKTASPRTVRRQYDVVRAIFTAAVDDDRLVRSPCRNVKLPSIEQETRRVITAEELARLGARLGPDWSPMLHLGAVLGLRWGECAGLRVGRLDFANRTLAVAEQLTRVRPRCHRLGTSEVCRGTAHPQRARPP